MNTDGREHLLGEVTLPATPVRASGLAVCGLWAVVSGTKVSEGFDKILLPVNPALQRPGVVQSRRVPRGSTPDPVYGCIHR